MIRKFASQPQYNASIDYSGLGKGVQLLFNPALGPIDLVTGRRWTPVGDITNGTSPRGKVFKYPGVSGSYEYTGYPEITGNIGTFFIWCPTVGPSDDFGHVYFAGESTHLNWYQIHSFGNIFLMGTESSTGITGWYNSTNRSLVLSSGGTVSTMGAYLDGVKTSVTWPSGPLSWGVGDKLMALGRYTGGVVHDFNGTMLIAGYTTEAWGTAEAKAFHDNPFQVFKYAYRSRHSVISIGGNTYTISPSGGLILSGSSNLIKTKFFLPIGNVSFSGNSKLIKGKILLPFGNISMTGGTPLVKTKIVNSSGTITLSGTSPIIRSKVIESSGGVIFSGTASLSGAVSYILTPIGGVAFNGSSSLIKTHIQIPTGKISFSGNSPIESNTVIITVSTRLPLTGVGK